MLLRLAAVLAFFMMSAFASAQDATTIKEKALDAIGSYLPQIDCTPICGSKYCCVAVTVEIPLCEKPALEANQTVAPDAEEIVRNCAEGREIFDLESESRDGTALPLGCKFCCFDTPNGSSSCGVCCDF